MIKEMNESDVPIADNMSPAVAIAFVCFKSINGTKAAMKRISEETKA